MLRVRVFDPRKKIPHHEPKHESARLVTEFARKDFLQQMKDRALRDHRKVFVATEDGELVSQGVTTIQKVIDAKAGVLRLSGSHARHKVDPSLPQPEVGKTFEFSIDPISNRILHVGQARQQKTSLKPASRFEIDLRDLPNLRANDARFFFSRVQRQPHIPFQYLADGCWARAHEMCRLIETFLDHDPRTVTAKVWNIASVDVLTENNPDCEVHWFHHVAPVIKVAWKLVVIDPALFGKPVPIKDWLSVQRGASPNVVFTSREAYNPVAHDELYASEEQDQTDAELRANRDFLAAQILSRGPLPYRCGRK